MTSSPTHCRCNTERHDPDCHIDHTLSVLEANIAFPQMGQEGNPNPMHSRCGLGDCDCEYTIEKLVKALRELADHVHYDFDANCVVADRAIITLRKVEEGVKR